VERIIEPIRFLKYLKMANPPNSEHAVVSASSVRDDRSDSWVDKEGYVSLGNSLKHGNETLEPSARPSLSIRSPTGAN
jgi:hypothetical protein